MNTQNSMPLSNEELERRINILRGQSFYLGDSYYPELPSKSNEERFNDLVGQIKKYGWPDFQYLQYGMDVKTDEECAQYVNAMEFVYRRNFLNFEHSPINSCIILRNKLYFDIIAHSLGIETPRIVAYYNNGTLFSTQNGFHRIELKDIYSWPEKSYFCKDLSGECGKGIFKIAIKNGNIIKDRDIISLDGLHTLLSSSDYIFQEQLQQHPKMNELYEGSINTIRLVTTRNLKDDKIHILPSILRIGANGSIVDNTSQGGIAVGFNLETGQLNKKGCYKPQYGRFTEVHPNSGIRFEDFYIPYIKQAEDKALFFHSMLFDIHSIGWDIAIGSDGPIFVEGNDDWEITGPQACNGGLRKEFEEYFFE